MSTPNPIALSEPLLQFVTCISPKGLHRMAYWEWGDAHNPAVVVCAHGLTRNGRDFDQLARRLAQRFRVICPDFVGRGASDYAADSSVYQIPQYLADSVTLLARLNVDKLTWVGTSMGGLIGMAYASMPRNPIARLVLNDIGPQLDPRGLARIAGYVGAAPQWASREAAVADIQNGSGTSFALKTPEQWAEFTRHYVVQKNGQFVLNYDPRISEPFKTAPPATPIWPLYDAIQVPTLLVRGADSDLLSKEVALQMTQRGPRATLVEVADVGHAPSFIPPDQIDLVDQFLP